MTRSKIHHYVPKVLQKPFTIDGERTWYAKKDARGFYSAPELKRTEKIFYKRNYYTVRWGNEYSDIYERRHYGSIDDYLGKVIPFVTNNLKQRTIPVFSQQYLTDFRHIVMEMMKRTPDYLKEFDEETTGREVIEDLLLDPNGRLSEADRAQLKKDLADRQVLIDLGRTARVRVAAQHVKSIEPMLRQYRVIWVLAPAWMPFILSSRMVCRIGNGGPNGFKNKNMEIWMPIGPHVCAVLIRDPTKSLKSVIVLSPNKVMEVNEYMARNSYEIASNNLEALNHAISQFMMNP